MISPENLIRPDLLLTNLDFPSNYRDMAHPDDYNVMDEPIEKEHLYFVNGNHIRLIFRISWKINNQNKYVPMTFICDTGAPEHLYLSERAISILKDGGRISTENELQVPVIKINNKIVTYDDTPVGHRPANIIGLKLISKLGLSVKTNSFKLGENEKYF